jgi:AcrR family transcriptional regulator
MVRKLIHEGSPAVQLPSVVTEAGTPLPRGRHGIDRADVRAHQRARILDATIECVAEKGYAPTTVGHIVSRARVSRETFYELFTDKAVCYDAALEETTGAITQAWAAEVADDGVPPLERMARGLRGYFSALAERPSLTTCFILEGPEARRQRVARAQIEPEVVDAVAAIAGTEDRFAVRCYLAMVDGIVRRYTASGRTDELPELVDELMPVVARTLGIDG